VGLVKQHIYAEDPLLALPINSLLPHYLARLSKVSGARLIHISTDCVYSGSRGMYLETDQSDAHDLYGRSKFLGEVHCSNAITLRTSIIGHELNGSKSLVNWFLSQKNCIQGYTKAIFSGLPTVEIARVIHHYILPNSGLNGLYHLSAEPISKFELLSLIKDQYEKEIEIISNEAVVIDRSLDSTKFRVATGFKPKPWVNLIQEMHEFH
jgi:dTDP-4-dehydrorhamnose reductase